MSTDWRLFPETASSAAGSVDALTLFLTALTVFFGTLISGFVIVLALRYRRRYPGHRAERPRDSLALELSWTAVPLAVVLVIFLWGAVLFVRAAQPPEGALEIQVVGKQWMWKVRHPEGRREINELHVPAGRPVRLTLASEDVIHSFYVPAFRIKQDAVPGRTTALWFQATRTGTYHLFCAEYCGTLHSRMTGRVVVLEPGPYERWLAGASEGDPLASGGERLFVRMGCAGCHLAGPGARGPALEGILGRKVRLEGGGEVEADEAYVRESILDPGARITAGFPPIMPIYRGQLDEEDLLQILEYLKSLGRRAGP